MIFDLRINKPLAKITGGGAGKRRRLLKFESRNGLTSRKPAAGSFLVTNCVKTVRIDSFARRPAIVGSIRRHSFSLARFALNVRKPIMLFRLFPAAAVISVGLLLTVAAVAQKVEYNFERGTDFSKFKTYKWQRAEKARYPEDYIDRILTAAIDEQLVAKGLTKIEGEAADLYVIYQLAIKEDVMWSSFSSEVGWAGSVGSRPFTVATTMTPPEKIRVGWMILDLYDVSQKKLVWQASATKTLSDTNDPNKMGKNARKAMAKIFKKYPPPG
jgi:hypothetical protein